jgi:hypothetical protein
MSSDQTESELNEFLDELARISKELQPFHDRLSEGIQDSQGTYQERVAAWVATLTDPEHVFERMYTFLQIALINAGDVIGHVESMIENKNRRRPTRAIRQHATA